MKYLKTFENKANNKPKEGDFVLIKLNIYPHANGEPLNDEQIEIIENSIGYINYIDPNDGNQMYSISTDNDELENLDIWITKDEIIHFSESEDELEMMQKTKKYNL